MFQQAVYKSHEKISWDRFKENEEEYKTLQVSFTKLNRKYLEMSKKVVHQKKHILLGQYQSIRMSKGGGQMLFPCPIFGDLSSSKQIVCILNACSFCRLWFNCNKFITTFYEHTYHPWCIGKHAKVFSQCIVPFCETIFTIDWSTAWGFQSKCNDVQGLVQIHHKFNMQQINNENHVKFIHSQVRTFYT